MYVLFFFLKKLNNIIFFEKKLEKKQAFKKKKEEEKEELELLTKNVNCTQKNDLIYLILFLKMWMSRSFQKKSTLSRYF